MWRSVSTFLFCSNGSIFHGGFARIFYESHVFLGSISGLVDVMKGGRGCAQNLIHFEHYSPFSDSFFIMFFEIFLFGVCIPTQLFFHMFLARPAACITYPALYTPGNDTIFWL
jgi:hypothetical protein